MLSMSGEDIMLTVVEVGQKWSVWVPGRQQWLLATVIRSLDGQATLKYDPRYLIGAGFDEQRVDESAMLASRSLYRPV